MEAADAARIAKALSDTNRLRILEMLSEGEKCGCVLLERCDISQPTLSHHMRILAECRLVNERRDGRWHHYSPNRDTMEEYILFMEGILKECRYV